MENKTKIHDIMEKKVLSILDFTLHILSLFLILALVIVILRELSVLFLVDILKADVQTIVDNILFILILVELFTILYAYLKKHYIKVERVVEVGIISIVREVIFKIFDIEVTKIYALSAILLVMGGIFFIEKKYSKERDV